MVISHCNEFAVRVEPIFYVRLYAFSSSDLRGLDEQ